MGIKKLLDFEVLETRVTVMDEVKKYQDMTTDEFWDEIEKSKGA